MSVYSFIKDVWLRSKVWEMNSLWTLIKYLGFIKSLWNTSLDLWTWFYKQMSLYTGWSFNGLKGMGKCVCIIFIKNARLWNEVFEEWTCYERRVWINNLECLMALKRYGWECVYFLNQNVGMNSEKMFGVSYIIKWELELKSVVL